MTTVLDTSILIAFFNSHDTHHAAAVRILDEASAEDLVLSSISLAEVLVGPARSGDHHPAPSLHPDRHNPRKRDLYADSMSRYPAKSLPAQTL